jgi:hypothetical protein
VGPRAGLNVWPLPETRLRYSVFQDLSQVSTRFGGKFLINVGESVWETCSETQNLEPTHIYSTTEKHEGKTFDLATGRTFWKQNDCYPGFLHSRRRNVAAVLTWLYHPNNTPVPTSQRTQSASVVKTTLLIPSREITDCLGAFAKLRKRLSILSCLSVLPFVRLSARKNFATTGRILMKFDIRFFPKTLPRKFHYNMTRKTGTFYEDFLTFMIISRLIILRTENILETNL